MNVVGGNKEACGDITCECGSCTKAFKACYYTSALEKEQEAFFIYIYILKRLDKIL